MPALAEQIVTVLEYLLMLTGAGFLAWLFLRPAGRAWREQPPRLPVWTVSLADFLLLAWLIVVLGFLTQGVMRLTVGGALRRLPEADTAQVIVYGSMFHFGAILTWIFARWYFPRQRALQGLVAPPPANFTAGQISRGALLTFLSSITLVTLAALGWEPLLRLAGLPTEHQEIVDFFVEVRSPVLMGFMVAFALVVAPIGEELVFRAGIFRFLRARAPRWVAYAASAGIFALFHLNWVSFFPLLVLGMIFAAAYEFTGCLLVPIVAHALFNLNSLLQVLGGGAR